MAPSLARRHGQYAQFLQLITGAERPDQEGLWSLARGTSRFWGLWSRTCRPGVPTTRLPGTVSWYPIVRKGGTTMPSPDTRPPGTRLARCIRWLGFERNPLRRRTDRIEAAIRLATMVLLLVAVPIAVIAAGRQADHLALRQAHAQQAVERQVTAVLLRQAQATVGPDPYTSIQLTYVLGRWQPPGQPA